MKEIFDKVNQSIDKNFELRVFKDVIEKDNLLLIELKDYEGLRQNVWLGFLSELSVEVAELVEFYKSKKTDLELILEEAGKEIEDWENLIDQFNTRFYVPFKVSLKNQKDILLKQAKAVLEFEFDDKREQESVKSDGPTLYKVLSKGEQKAYFILQLLFEINSKRTTGQVPLVVFDDIADSFDYKNKYAIIEYIKDLHSSDDFKLLILTHNFDFYRTVASRLDLNRGVAVLMASKDMSGEITLNRGEYVYDIFRHLLGRAAEKKVFVTLIPFLRNIIMYTDVNNCEDYVTLSKCLHLKTGSEVLVCQDVVDIWNSRFGNSPIGDIGFGNEGVVATIYETAEQILSDEQIDEVSIENKIVLSVAIRLKAEEFMIGQIKEVSLDDIGGQQTSFLFNQYKETDQESSKVQVLDKVILMTPENIHINAFMYEPLVDISVHHLVGLYDEVRKLSS